MSKYLLQLALNSWIVCSHNPQGPTIVTAFCAKAPYKSLAHGNKTAQDHHPTTNHDRKQIKLRTQTCEVQTSKSKLQTHNTRQPKMQSGKEKNKLTTNRRKCNSRCTAEKPIPKALTLHRELLFCSKPTRKEKEQNKERNGREGFGEVALQGSPQPRPYTTKR